MRLDYLQPHDMPKVHLHRTANRLRGISQLMVVLQARKNHPSTQIKFPNIIVSPFLNQ